MDMSMSSTMTMAMGSATMTSSAASAATTSGSSMDMGGMGMDMGDPHACQISMLWNWNVLDTCFISSTWHIRSRGMFAGSCIGVVLLVMSLGFLRRLHRWYDARIARSIRSKLQSSDQSEDSLPTAYSNSPGGSNKKPLVSSSARPARVNGGFRRPSVIQQAIRSFLHMTQFAVAYFVMLMAMYYNGYIIICILIGAFVGYFVFEWEPLVGQSSDSERGGATEVTGCCG